MGATAPDSTCAEPLPTVSEQFRRLRGRGTASGDDAFVADVLEFYGYCPAGMGLGRYPQGMSETIITREALAVRDLIVARREEFQGLLDRYGAANARLFGSVARGTAHSGSDVDILVDMDPADGNLLMRASGLMEEVRALFGRDDIDVFPAQMLRRPISASALEDAVPL